MLNTYRNYLIGEKKSPNTIKNYVKYVGQMMDFVKKPVDAITFMDLTDWKVSISHLAPASVALQISAIKNFFEWLVACEIISVSPAAKLTNPHIKSREKHYLEAEDVRAMVNACTNDRDRAIVIMYGTTGLRTSEMFNVTLEQFLAGRELVILGKGDKERVVYINDETHAAIMRYLEMRPESDQPYLFLSHRGGKIDCNTFNKTLKRIARTAHVEHWDEVSNHVMRHACATMYAKAGVDVSTIRDILGHSSIATTNRYLHGSRERVASAMIGASTF